ncbi:unnamed protein product [Lasius platythorax]|uniref:Uncharacterized protein n=2 Tax=Lasius TaxID=488720 RepID=A0A0J7K665_LASNI|nr:hypothetical protein RF55_15349 [Lasius niger]
MAKNGPGVALNRPQDTERYNAKDSIVRRAVKCSCLVFQNEVGYAQCRSALLRFPFILTMLYLRPCSSPRYLLVNSEGGGGRGSFVELRKLREE